ncbi:hypothetical protein ACTWPT_17605 [Nonomuraea sp. 3N208]|uniref:hypothetical protein n=1 Tax=Nonomuraea sp. 3N208 TaxID=3457421 RepID=UPI003FCD8525
MTGELGDLAEGTRVLVRGQGTEAGDRITAERVGITPDTMRLPELPDLGGRFGHPDERRRPRASIGRAGPAA